MEGIKWECLTFEALSNLQLYKIIQLREKVFVVEQNCAYLDTDEKDFYAKHLLAWKGDLLVGYARLLPPNISYEDVSIGRLVSDSTVRRSGIGKVLMQKSIAELTKDFPKENIRISAQVYLKKFYESFGFQQQGTGYMEDGLPHIEMLKLCEKA